jgi:hypothetical protein
MGWRPPELAVVCVMGLSAVLFACGSESDDNGASPTSGGNGEIVAATATAQAPAPTADAATAPLFGTWRTTIAERDIVTLILRPGRYSISRGGPAGAGRMSATATEIELTGSNLCDGTGRYTWSVTNGELTFTSIGADECSGRSEVLDGKTYRK